METIKPLRDVIVHVEQRYQNYKELPNGNKIWLTNARPDVHLTNRFGTVVALPLKYKINLEVGDKIYFHHNIIRDQYVHGNTTDPGKFMISKERNWYRVPPTEIYAKERDGEFSCFEPHVFVKPITHEDKVTETGIIIPGGKKKKQLIGRLKYINDQIRDMGLGEGDLITFSKDSEFKFWVHEELLYLMKTKDITGKLEEGVNAEGIYERKADKVE